MVEGAAFFLLCHDDVVLDPDAVHKLVEESFRSNAGVVSPKFVNWDDPGILLHVGMSCDKTGAVVDRILEGEVDHGQHDAVRDVFVAPGGCILVRADLFSELKGFDAGIVAMGEDLDLSWRSQVAGSRVVVAPDVRVRHREAVAGGLEPLAAVVAETEGRHPVTMQMLQRRHELRAVLEVLHPDPPRAGAAAGGAVGLRRGRRRGARARPRPGACRRPARGAGTPGAAGEISRSRRRAGRTPPVPRRRGAPPPDAGECAPVAVLQPPLAPGSRGGQRGRPARRERPDRASERDRGRGPHRAASGLPSARTRISTSSTTWVGGRDGTASAAGSARLRSSTGRQRVVAMVVALAVIALGTRDLFFGTLPLRRPAGPAPFVVDELAPLRLGLAVGRRGDHGAGLTRVRHRRHHRHRALRRHGHVAAGPAPRLHPPRAPGASRVSCARSSLSRARVVAVICYLGLPLPYGALGTGRWDGLVAYAAFPFIALPAGPRGRASRPTRWSAGRRGAAARGPDRRPRCR